MDISQDYTEAVRWYRKAAEMGLAEAQLNLGGKYYEGQGVPQDYALDPTPTPTLLMSTHRSLF